MAHRCLRCRYSPQACLACRGRSGLRAREVAPPPPLPWVSPPPQLQAPPPAAAFPSLRVPPLAPLTPVTPRSVMSSEAGARGAALHEANPPVFRHSDSGGDPDEGSQVGDPLDDAMDDRHDGDANSDRDGDGDGDDRAGEAAAVRAEDHGPGEAEAPLSPASDLEGLQAVIDAEGFAIEDESPGAVDVQPQAPAPPKPFLDEPYQFETRVAVQDTRGSFSGWCVLRVEVTGEAAVGNGPGAGTEARLAGSSEGDLTLHTGDGSAPLAITRVRSEQRGPPQDIWWALASLAEAAERPKGVALPYRLVFEGRNAMQPNGGGMVCLVRLECEQWPLRLGVRQSAAMVAVLAQFAEEAVGLPVYRMASVQSLRDLYETITPLVRGKVERPLPPPSVNSLSQMAKELARRFKRSETDVTAGGAAPAKSVRFAAGTKASATPPQTAAAAVAVASRRGGPFGDTTLEHVPAELKLIVLGHLSARDLRVVACTCVEMRNLCAVIIPGFKLHLYRHQWASLRWMQRRETELMPDIDVSPSSFTLATEAGPPLEVNCTSRRIRSATALQLAPSRGGLLCDDPGLGKTVTVLALISRTRHLISTPPSIDRDQEVALLALETWSSVPPELQIQLLSALFKTTVYAVLNAITCPATLKKAESLVVGTRNQLFRKAEQYILGLIELVDTASNMLKLLDDELKTDIPLLTGLLQRLPETMRQFCNKQLLKKGDASRIAQQGLMADAEPSGATLVVVPFNVLSHWEKQIRDNLRLERQPAEGEAPASPTRGMYLRERDIYITSLEKRQELLPNAAVLAGKTIVVLPFEALRVQENCEELKKICWLRVVVDEGHLVEGSSSLGVALSGLISARKWAMTGTPSKETMQSQTAKIFSLLQFIGEPPFVDRDYRRGSDWGADFQRPFARRRLDAMLRLRTRLQTTMVRHTKNDLDFLPAPEEFIVRLRPSQAERETYNAIVSLVKTNIFLTEIRNDEDDKQPSFLRDRKSARLMFHNLRVACGHVMKIRSSEMEETDLQATLEILRNRHKCTDPGVIGKVVSAMRGTLTGKKTACEVCGQQTLLPLVLPCGHLLCFECQEIVSKVPSTEKEGAFDVTCRCNAPGCLALLDYQDIQRLQPGVLPYLNWPGKAWSLEAQDAVDQLSDVQVRGRVFTGRMPSKSGYLIQAIRDAMAADPHYKAIIFCEHIDHLESVGADIVQSFGEKRLALVCQRLVRYGKRGRHLLVQDEIHKFIEQPECKVALFTKKEALGLDMHFVTHIYLLEEMWDRELEKQVLARAWRLGAKRACRVEKLILAGTLEERNYDLHEAKKAGTPLPWALDAAANKGKKMTSLGLRMLRDRLQNLKLLSETA